MTVEYVLLIGVGGLAGICVLMLAIGAVLDEIEWHGLRKDNDKKKGEDRDEGES